MSARSPGRAQGWTGQSVQVRLTMNFCFYTFNIKPMIRLTELSFHPSAPEAEAGARDPGPLIREPQLRLHDGPVPPCGHRDARHRGLRAVGADTTTGKKTFFTRATKTFPPREATTISAAAEATSSPSPSTETETRDGKSSGTCGERLEL